MSWVNYYGLAIMVVIMAPNIVYAVTHKGETPPSSNRIVEGLEQIGRYVCLFLMIFNIPCVYFGFWFEHARTVYLCINGLLRALSLSVLPSAVFLFSGVISAYIPLIAFAFIFGSSHITISIKNSEGRHGKQR